MKLTSSATLINKLTVYAATIAQMKLCHVNEGLQKELTSSKLNKIPPIGALNAAATPAAAPMLTKSLLSFGLSKPWFL